MYASEMGRTETVAMLIDTGALLDVQDKVRGSGGACDSCVCMCACMCVCMSVWLCVSVSVCLCVYVSMCLCACVCVCIYLCVRKKDRESVCVERE